MNYKAATLKLQGYVNDFTRQEKAPLEHIKESIGNGRVPGKHRFISFLYHSDDEWGFSAQIYNYDKKTDRLVTYANTEL